LPGTAPTPANRPHPRPVFFRSGVSSRQFGRGYGARIQTAIASRIVLIHPFTPYFSNRKLDKFV
jgi:hypothetical protein